MHDEPITETLDDDEIESGVRLLADRLHAWLVRGELSEPKAAAGRKSTGAPLRAGRPARIVSSPGSEVRPDEETERP